MNEQCPHLDYGKSADKALGAYCTKHKMLAEYRNCGEHGVTEENCKAKPISLYRLMADVMGEDNLVKLLEEVAEGCEWCLPRKVCDCGYELYHEVFGDKYLVCSKCHKLYNATTGKPVEGYEEGEDEW